MQNKHHIQNKTKDKGKEMTYNLLNRTRITTRYPTHLKKAS